MRFAQHVINWQIGPLWHFSRVCAAVVAGVGRPLSPSSPPLLLWTVSSPALWRVWCVVLTYVHVYTCTRTASRLLQRTLHAANQNRETSSDSPRFSLENHRHRHLLPHHSEMPLLRAAAQRLGAASLRRFGAVATQGGNSLMEFVSGSSIAVGTTGVILSAYHRSMHTNEWVKG